MWIDECTETEVAQSCPTLRASVDSRLPGFSVHAVFQARILEWVAISFSRMYGKGIHEYIVDDTYDS